MVRFLLGLWFYVVFDDVEGVGGLSVDCGLASKSKEISPTC